MMKKKLSLLLTCLMLLTLCACGGSSEPAQTEEPAPDAAEEVVDAPEVQYDYQLKAGEPAEVYDVTFDKMVTVTVDPASTRDGSVDLRSMIIFDNCVFNAGLTVVGDYHAMVLLEAGCSFGDGAVVTVKEATPGAAAEITLDDNLVKVMASCENVTVETESAMGVMSGGPDFTFNGTVYSKAELTDTDYLGVYSIYEDDAVTYPKLGINNDDSIVVLD